MILKGWGRLSLEFHGHLIYFSKACVVLFLGRGTSWSSGRLFLPLGLLRVLKKRRLKRLRDDVSNKVTAGGLELSHGLKDYSEDDRAAEQALEVKRRNS